MFPFLILIFSLFSLSNLYSSVFITEIINNTDEELRINWNVPTNAQKKITREIAQERTGEPINISLIGAGDNTAFLIGIRSRGIICNSYIPIPHYAGDVINSIVISLYNGGWNKLTSIQQSNNNQLIFSSPIKVKIAEEIIDNECYTMKINKISNEVYYYDRLGKLIANSDAFEIIIYKNSYQSNC